MLKGENMYDYLTPLITFFVGIIALIVFCLKLRREMIDTAKIILLEIQAAETVIQNLKDTHEYRYSRDILPTNTWETQKHKLIKHLDDDDIKLISDFFNRCSVIQKRINFLREIFNIAIKEKAVYLQDKLIDLNLVKNSSTLRSELLDKTHKDTYFFEPAEPKTVIEKELNHISFITTSATGSKLKKIANKRF